MGNIDLLEDACAKLPHITRAMFGGHGLFAPNGGMFAGIVDDDRIILKLAQDPERADLIALGGAPWVYKGKMTMKDWIVIPDAFYDEPQTLAAWAKKAHAIAPGKAAKRPAKAPAGKRAAPVAAAAVPKKSATGKMPPKKIAPGKAPSKKSAPGKAPPKKIAPAGKSASPKKGTKKAGAKRKAR